MSKDYAVTVKISNGRIRRAMQNAGLKTVAELCRQAGVPQTEVGRLINLKQAPLNKDGQWRPVVLKLADVLGVVPDDLFSSAQRVMAVTENSVTKYVSEDEVHRLAAADMNAARLEFLQDNAALEEIDQEQKELLCKSIMESSLLSPREVKIIRRRVMGDDTLEDVAKEMDVTSERIRQIEIRAMRKMRAHVAEKMGETI